MSTTDHDREFADFVRRHDRRFRGFLRSLGAPSDLVDEVAPFAFLGVRRHWHRLRTQAPKAYLFTVGEREIGKRIGRSRHEPASTDMSGAELADQHNRVDDLIDRVTLDNLLDLLPLSLRLAVTLRHLEGFSVNETASIMNVRSGTVKRYTFDGLAALRGLLATEDDDWAASDREVQDR